MDRSGEADAYKPFKSSLPNKMLLWHGSRTSNYVGILSQGLRIAPPEAPVTGYMVRLSVLSKRFRLSSAPLRKLVGTNSSKKA